MDGVGIDGGGGGFLCCLWLCSMLLLTCIALSHCSLALVLGSGEWQVQRLGGLLLSVFSV